MFRSSWFLLILALPLAAQVAPDLRAFYQDKCSKCHGVDGTARDGDGKKLRGQDFTDPKWREKAEDAELRDTILKGKFFGMAMPAFKKDLTPEDAERMVREVVRKAEKGKVIQPEK